MAAFALGTKIPIRAAGAAQALGRSKGQAAKPKMPMGQKQPPAHLPQNNVQHHSAPRHNPAPAHQEKALIEMNPAQIHHYATKTVQQNTKTELAPYQQKATELGNSEQTVAKRFGGYGQATDSLLGGIQNEAGA